MAYSYTEATLTAAIVAHLEDDGAEFQAAIPNIINLAEAQLVKDLPFSIFDEIATGTLTSAILTKPTGWVKTINLFVTVNGAQQIVQPKPWDYVQLYGGAGNPLYYAETSETTLTVAPTPTSVPYTLRYIKRPETLVDAAGTTWLSENCPDALFWGCIACSENFRKADERVQQAKDFYMNALNAIRAELRHLIRVEYR